MAKKKKKFDAREKVAGYILEAMEKRLKIVEVVNVLRHLHGVPEREQPEAFWKKPWNAGLLPRNAERGNQYRGGNLFALSLLGSTPFWLTYKQATEHGGVVETGEHGTPILFTQFKEYEKKDGSKYTSFFRRYYLVFNVSQCRAATADDVAKWRKHAAEGFGRVKNTAVRALEAAKAKDSESDEKVAERMAKKWARFAKKLEKQQAEATKLRADVEPIARAQAIHDGYENGPKVTHKGERAFYRPSSDSITLPKPEKFETQEAYHATRFHEEVHSSGHKSRLNRETLEKTGSFGDHEYSKEELVAEFGAAMLCSEAGIETTRDNSVEYLMNWLGKLRNDPVMLYDAAQQAQRAVDHVLGITHENESEDESEKAA